MRTVSREGSTAWRTSRPAQVTRIVPPARRRQMWRDAQEVGELWPRAGLGVPNREAQDQRFEKWPNQRQMRLNSQQPYCAYPAWFCNSLVLAAATCERIAELPTISKHGHSNPE